MIEMKSIALFILAIFVVAERVAAETIEDKRATEFYSSCSAEDQAESSLSAPTRADYSCFVSPPVQLDQFDLVLDITNRDELIDAQGASILQIPFEQVLVKPWVKNKSLLLLDDGLSPVESARRCHRAKSAGLEETKVLLGGIRAYLSDNKRVSAEERVTIVPAQAVGAIEQNRAQLFDLDHYLTTESGVFDWRHAWSDLENLAPPKIAEQYMPVVLVGEIAHYQALKNNGAIPYWAYYLVGGEEGYRHYLQGHHQAIALRDVKLRKCALR